MHAVLDKKYSFCESLCPPSSLFFSCMSLTLDNFADRLSRFQQRDVVAYLNEETDVRRRMLTVLFKVLKGRTKVLTTPYKAGVSSRFSRALLWFSLSDARAAGRDENFSLERQDAVTRLWGIPGGILRIIYRPGAARGNDDDGRIGARQCTSRINWRIVRENRRQRSIWFEASSGISLFSFRINPGEKLLIGQYFIYKGNEKRYSCFELETFRRYFLLRAFLLK